MHTNHVDQCAVIIPTTEADCLEWLRDLAGELGRGEIGPDQYDRERSLLYVTLARLRDPIAKDEAPTAPALAYLPMA